MRGMFIGKLQRPFLGIDKELRLAARALNRDMGVSQTSWHKEVILGRNSVFRVFRLYLWSSDLMLQ